MLRKRYLYALFFPNGCAYIGQTVDPMAREKQHRAPSGGWCDAPFEFVVLSSMDGTQAQAEEYEFAYRWKANRRGWALYGRPHVPIRRIRRHLTPSRWLLACGLPWPKGRTLNMFTRCLRLGSATTALALALTAMATI
jgi:predicted GIY-YIG superfamily endonuclease